MIQDTLYITSAVQMTLLSNSRISNHKNPRTSTVSNNAGEMGWACSITEIWERQRILAARPKGKRPIRADGHVCKDNISTDTTEIMFEGTKRVKAAQDCVKWRTLMNTIINFWVLQTAENFCFGTLCFSRRPQRHGVGEFVCAVVDSDWQLRLHVQL